MTRNFVGVQPAQVFSVSGLSLVNAPKGVNVEAFHEGFSRSCRNDLGDFLPKSIINVVVWPTFDV
jgi:hypothetical protein